MTGRRPKPLSQKTRNRNRDREAGTGQRGGLNLSIVSSARLWQMLKGGKKWILKLDFESSGLLIVCLSVCLFLYSPSAFCSFVACKCFAGCKVRRKWSCVNLHRRKCLRRPHFFPQLGQHLQGGPEASDCLTNDNSLRCAWGTCRPALSLWMPVLYNTWQWTINSPVVSEHNLGMSIFLSCAWDLKDI